MIDGSQCMGSTVDFYLDERSLEHQLIVLGNGFDLACGLPSDYRSFFKGVTNAIYPDKALLNGVTWGVYLQEHGFTAWDIILCGGNPDKSWYDVEGVIAEWVKKFPERGILRDTIHMTRMEACLKGNENHAPDWGNIPMDWRQYKGKRLDRYVEAEVARYLLDTRPGIELSRWDSERWRTELLSILLDELHVLERRFCKYMADNIEGNDAYHDWSMELLLLLIGDRTFTDSSRYRTTLLNFNYSTPGYWIDIDDTNQEEFNSINIHGTIDDGEVVFGIDGSNCMNDDAAIPYTKTYRIMDMNMDDITDIVFPVSSKYGIRTETIKFFGHSLGDADYAYFQAIFDGVDLYGGTATLIFYFRPYGADNEDSDTKRTRCRTSMMKQVTKLLVAYGNTLDNKDHGKNLMHKLLLEGRLHVFEI